MGKRAAGYPRPTFERHRADRTKILRIARTAQAHFCLHTEGNGWGARVVDYMAMECLPLMINDGMIFPYSNVINWDTFAIHLRKRQGPDIPTILRNISTTVQLSMHTAQRRYKRAFVWWRPDGLAYEYTLAALGQRVVQLGLDKP